MRNTNKFIRATSRVSDLSCKIFDEHEKMNKRHFKLAQGILNSIDPSSKIVICDGLTDRPGDIVCSEVPPHDRQSFIAGYFRSPWTDTNRSQRLKLVMFLVIVPARIPLMVMRMLNFPAGWPFNEIRLSKRDVRPEVEPANMVLATILPNVAPDSGLIDHQVHFFL